MMRDSNEQLIE